MKQRPEKYVLCLRTYRFINKAKSELIWTVNSNVLKETNKAFIV